MVFDDIKEHLNGYARVVYYKRVVQNTGTITKESFELDKVVEGQFVNGEMNGYCRGISAVNGGCFAGFHKNDVPNGKYCYYK